MASTRFKQKLREKILSYKPDFNLEVLNVGLDQFKLSDCKAGENIVTAGEVCKKVFFVEKSISRCYFLDLDGEEKTLWLEPEMSFMSDYESFNLQVNAIFIFMKIPLFVLLTGKFSLIYI